MSEDRVTAADLERETEALEVLTGEFARTRDPDKIAELTMLTQAQAKRLKEMADRMGAEHEEEWAEQAVQASQAGDPLRGKVEIELSPRQRERVKALTGDDVETVMVPDPTGTMTLGMAVMNPSQVELWAVQHVIAQRRARDAAADGERIEGAAKARIQAVQAAAGVAPDDLEDEDDDE